MRLTPTPSLILTLILRSFEAKEGAGAPHPDAKPDPHPDPEWLKKACASSLFARAFSSPLTPSSVFLASRPPCPFAGKQTAEVAAEMTPEEKAAAEAEKRAAEAERETQAKERAAKAKAAAEDRAKRAKEQAATAAAAAQARKVKAAADAAQKQQVTDSVLFTRFTAFHRLLTPSHAFHRL